MITNFLSLIFKRHRFFFSYSSALSQLIYGYKFNIYLQIQHSVGCHKIDISNISCYSAAIAKTSVNIQGYMATSQRWSTCNDSYDRNLAKASWNSKTC